MQLRQLVGGVCVFAKMTSGLKTTHLKSCGFSVGGVMMHSVQLTKEIKKGKAMEN